MFVLFVEQLLTMNKMLHSLRNFSIYAAREYLVAGH